MFHSRGTVGQKGSASGSSHRCDSTLARASSKPPLLEHKNGGGGSRCKGAGCADLRGSCAHPRPPVLAEPAGQGVEAARSHTMDKRAAAQKLVKGGF